jgi:superfamily I DNA/RNA helicase
VRFNQVQGPKPFLQRFDSRDAEIMALGNHIAHLTTKEGISPSDICLIYNGKSAVRILESKLAPRLAGLGLKLSVQTNRPFERQANTLLATTSHSYKGYDAEVVLIPCADLYTTRDGQVLSANLYVAMTRARSLLGIYSVNSIQPAARKLNENLQACVDAQGSTPLIDSSEYETDER